MDDPEEAPSLNSFSGLNMVDFYPLPHYKDIPFSEVTMDIEKQYKEQLNFCFINNLEGLIVEGNHTRIVKN